MGQEFDFGDDSETSDQLSERLSVLDGRREHLAGGRDALTVDRQQLAPVEAFVAAKNEEFGGRARSHAAEEKAIARDAAELRRDIASARKNAAKAQKQQLKDLAEEHKGQLEDLDSVAGELADFQKDGTENA